MLGSIDGRIEQGASFPSYLLDVLIKVDKLLARLHRYNAQPAHGLFSVERNIQRQSLPNKDSERSNLFIREARRELTAAKV